MNEQEARAYFEANPDVATAFAANNYGLSAEQFAGTHWENFGQHEPGRLRAKPVVAPNRTVGLIGVPEVPPAAQPAPTPPPRVGTIASGQTMQTPTIAQQAQGQAYAGESPAQVAARQAAAVDPAEAYRAQRKAEVAAQNAPREAYSKWLKQLEAQPWYREFVPVWRVQGAANWAYTPRRDSWSNFHNELLDKYGTTDPIEYAVKQGMAPPPGVVSGTGRDYNKAWSANPAASQRDETPQPETPAFWQDVNRRRTQIAQSKLIPKGAPGVAPTPPKPESSEEDLHS